MQLFNGDSQVVHHELVLFFWLFSPLLPLVSMLDKSSFT